MGLTLQKIKTWKKWQDSDNVNVTNTDTFQVNEPCINLDASDSRKNQIGPQK